MTSSPDKLRKTLPLAALAYLAFVIYGSLVPLDFHAREWHDALRAFARIPYLDLGIASRADWIANILLYIPLSFSWAAIVARRPGGKNSLPALLLILSAAIALAVGIEFTQLFFPPRTVSLNDILAETIGSTLGIILWLACGKRLLQWLTSLFDSRHDGGGAALAAALSLYLLAYLALSLFPFDFVVTSAELAQRFAGDQNALLFSSASCSSSSRCLAGFLIEILAALPLGVMVVRIGKSLRTPRVAIAMLMGAALGLLIEGAQLFLHSGVSEGLSVLTRSIGAGCGAYAYWRLLLDPGMHGFFTPRRVRLFGLWMAPLYLLGLIGMQNWRMDAWLSVDAGLSRLPQVHFLPFYYHYYTTETAALSSLLRIAVSYAPIGIILWMRERTRRNDALPAMGFALLLALLLESAKLLQPQLHPDPTNMLIAAFAAAAGYALINWWHALHGLSVPSVSKQHKEQPPAPPASAPSPVQPSHPSAAGRRLPLLALLSSGMLAWAIALYPLGAHWLGAGTLLYIAILQRWPQAWLLLLPAALPVLDLTAWSGRFFFDEFDCLLLATVMALGWRAASKKSSYRLPPAALFIVLLLTLSTVAALLIGSYPFPAFDSNSFSHYYSHYNALRVGKGLAWALLLLPFLKTALEHDAVKTHRLFASGMTMGVLAAAIAVLWERLAFVGLLDFTSDYRVVGMFSGMHTGGAYIEGYLATALPFVAWWTLMQRRVLVRLFGIGVFVLGLYALMVTYARGGYIALAFGMAVLALGLWLRRTASINPGRMAGGLLALLLMTGVAWPVLQGSYMQDRFSTTQRDAHIRTAHWQDALHMMGDDLPTTLFGMGLGRYPETYFWHNAEGAHLATYRLMDDVTNASGKPALSLSAGDPLYFEQLVDVLPHQRYQLRVVVKSQSDKAVLRLPLCEKWMLYAATCISKSIRIGNTNGQWRRHTIDLDTSRLQEQSWYARRTVKLALLNATEGALLDIRQVSMKSNDGKELIRNGDFSAGMDHWFFATDNHLPWHFKNLWLQVYFEQGLLGLFLFGCLIAYTFAMLAKRSAETDVPIPALAAALVGFLTVGVVDSLFDAPRMALLFYLLVAWVLLQKRQFVKNG